MLADGQLGRFLTQETNKIEALIRAGAERLLARAGGKLAPRLLDFYPAVVWEDQDECLEVRPEDVIP